MLSNFLFEISTNIGRGSTSFVQSILSQKHLMVSIRYCHQRQITQNALSIVAKNFPLSHTGEEIEKDYCSEDKYDSLFYEDEYDFDEERLICEGLTKDLQKMVIKGIEGHKHKKIHDTKCIEIDDLRDALFDIFDTLEDQVGEYYVGVS